MNAKGFLVALLMLLPSWAVAQGFAGLGSSDEGFAVPQRGIQFVFPNDHGPHPDYRIEWWYVTANLTGSDGTPYGVQWTLFRTALAPTGGTGWTTPQVWMGHAAVTTPSAHFVEERLARGGIGQAGAVADPYAVWIDDWEMAGDFDAPRLAASGAQFAYDLALTAKGPIVRHGDRGYSVKSAAGQASYYYSQPFYDVAGMLTLPDGDVAVTGQAWLDREWSSQPLAADQTGWDWVSLSFEDGSKLMGFELRGAEVYTSATWIAPDGTPTALPMGALQLTPLETARVEGRNVPVTWSVQLPSMGVDVRIDALNTAAWMATSVPYWEGPVKISGSHAGVGYLEMTGYTH